MHNWHLITWKRNFKLGYKMDSILRSTLLCTIVVGIIFHLSGIGGDDKDRLAEVAGMFDQRSIVRRPRRYRAPCQAEHKPPASGDCHTAARRTQNRALVPAISRGHRRQGWHLAGKRIRMMWMAPCKNLATFSSGSGNGSSMMQKPAKSG